MIGNDVVDLKQAAIDSNWARKGYLDKIYTSQEQELILEASDPDQMVWLLWSMKEAAYKIHSRHTGIRKYAPTSLICTNLEHSNKAHIHGTITVGQIRFYTKSEIKEHYIHTIAASSLPRLSQIKEVIYQCSPSQIDYKSTSPKCVSHHGRYLALIY